MRKAEKMDNYLNACTNKISSNEIFQVVHTVYNFDLDQAPVLVSTTLTPRETLDNYLQQFPGAMSGTEIRNLVNQLLGVNLEGISALEGAQISLYAKNQWIYNEETDLYVVYSTDMDRVARVFTTPYFAKQYGNAAAPEGLVQALLQLGYTTDGMKGSFIYKNAEDQAVPDAFKRQTMGAILQSMRSTNT